MKDKGPITFVTWYRLLPEIIEGVDVLNDAVDYGHSE